MWQTSYTGDLFPLLLTVSHNTGLHALAQRLGRRAMTLFQSFQDFLPLPTSHPDFSNVNPVCSMVSIANLCYRPVRWLSGVTVFVKQAGSLRAIPRTQIKVDEEYWPHKVALWAPHTMPLYANAHAHMHAQIVDLKIPVTWLCYWTHSSFSNQL